MPIMAMTCLVVVHVAFVLEAQLLNVGPIIAKLGKLLMACMTKRCLVKEGTIACCKQYEFGIGNVGSTSGVINL